MLQQLQTTPTADGNTGSSAARNWVFTIPVNQFPRELLFQQLQKIAKSFVFQHEVGEETNYEHHQGYIELKKKNRRTFLRNTLGPFHFEVCRNRDAAIKYCSNPLKRRIGKPVTFNLELPYSGEDLLHQDDFFPWQKFLHNIIMTEPDDRSIYWFFETDGCVGKSKFAKTICYHNPNVCLVTATKSADILTCAETHFTTYIFDFPRSLGEFCPFNALEQLKNGFITDCKLKKQGRTLMFKPPHVIILSNRMPKTEKLSQDRWKIYEIKTNDITHINLTKIWDTKYNHNPNPNPNQNSLLPL